MGKREQEAFREDLSKSLNTFTNMRLINNNVLARHVDADAVNKCRMKIYNRQSRAIERMASRSGDYDDMEKARATKGDYKIDEREFALEDNITLIYINFYGENFEGGEIMDNTNDGWVCPGCKLRYVMSLKGLPDRCKRCGWQTPLGRLKKDDAFRR